MASHRYQQIPTTEEISLPEYTPTQSQTQTQSEELPIREHEQNHTNNQYFSGLPTSAPPSFYSTQDVAPHVGTDVKVTPQERAHAQTQGDQDGVSVWAPSEFESGGATSSMEDAMVRLMDRVAVLEGRLGVDLDLESGAQKEYTSPLAREKWKREEVMVTAFSIWLCVTITWILVK